MLPVNPEQIQDRNNSHNNNMSAEDLKEISEKFAGQWEHIRTENLDAFLEALGLNFLIRKMASKMNPSCEISVDGQDIRIVVKAKKTTGGEPLRLGEEREADTEQGKARTLLTYSAGVLKQTMTPDAANKSAKGPIDTERRINGEGGVEVTATLGSVTMRRFFKRK